MRALPILASGLIVASALACAPIQASPLPKPLSGLKPIIFKPLVKSDAEWRKVLSPAAYNILRQDGTERAYSGAYWDLHTEGLFVCAACNLPLFGSETKFDSGTGWPSFYQPVASNVVKEITDTTFGMDRTEVKCARCGGHLGHVFNDGPRPTGLRYCINSPALKFIPKAPKKHV